MLDQYGNPIKLPAIAENFDVETSAIAGGAFEGAARTKQMPFWTPRLRSADAEILPDMKVVKARARDAFKNDPLVASAARNEKDVVVGDQWRLNHKPWWELLGRGFDAVWAAEFSAEMEPSFELYAHGTMRYADAEGNKTLLDMARLAAGTGLIDGSVLAVLEYITEEDEPGRPFGTALKFISTDRLSNPNDAPDSQYLRGGVELNRNGKAIAYWIREAHPTDSFMGSIASARTWKRVERYKPWGRPMVAHLYEQNSAEQTAGISAIASVLKDLKLSDDYRDITMEAIILAASYAGTMESDAPSPELFARMGAGGPAVGPDARKHGEDTFMKNFENFYDRYMEMASTYTSGNSGTLNGVKIPHLPMGTKLKIQPLSSDANQGSEFEKSGQRRIAAGLGHTFEELTKNFSDANFAILKHGVFLTQRSASYRRKLYPEQISNVLFRCFVEEAIMRGKVTSIPRKARDLDWLYGGQHMDALANAKWIAGSRGQVDEVKETQAAVMRINAKISTREIEAGKLGYDYEDVAYQLAAEQALDDKLGLQPPQTKTNSEAALLKKGKTA